MITLSKNLVELIELNSDKLRKRVVEDIRKHHGTKTYHTLSEAQIYSWVLEVYSQFDKWMSNVITKEEIKRNYTALGRQQRKEGFALSEVIQALIITRRHIWLLVDYESFLDTAQDLRMAIDLVNQTLLFFDRAIYFTAVGFETKD